MIDRDDLGEPTGILRETAMHKVAGLVPVPSDRLLDQAMARTLRALARLGVTAVHSMDSARAFRSRISPLSRE